MKKKILLSISWLLCSLSLLAQQSAAEEILQKMATAFRQSSGTRLEFVARNYDGTRLQGSANGVLHLKGERFKLETSEGTTWFNGQTQWSLLEGSGEVNVSTPTAEELQSINPYSLLYKYEHNYRARLGLVKHLAGKRVVEVILTPKNRQQEWEKVVIFASDKDYLPVSVELHQRGGRGMNVVLVTHYQTNRSYKDAFFVFQPSEYPNVEIIDLR